MAPKLKMAQTCKAMKELGYSEKTVRPVVNQLLKLYEDNWMLIEDDSYRVLVEAILDSEEQKSHGNKSKQPNTWSGDDAHENEPLVKKPRLNSPKKQSSPSFNASIPICSNGPENQTHDMDIREDESDSRHDFSETGNPYELLSDELPIFEVPLAVLSPDPPILLLQEVSYENCSKAKESPIYPEVIDLDAEDDEDISHDMLPKDAYFVENSCDLKQNHSELMNYTSPEAEKIEYDARDPVKLDIATSSRGDAKICLTINASLGSGFRVPSLEAVLKQVEEQCLKSYGIPRAGFSLLGLMNEVCECFLAAGTTQSTSTDTENIGPANEMSSLDIISENPDSEIGPSEVSNNQLSLFDDQSTVSNDPVIIRNLFEVSPQIPRFFGLVQLDLSRGTIYLNVDVTGSVKMDQDIKGLNSGACSSSELVIFRKQHCCCYVKDITKGHEYFEISLINEINEDQGPPTFNYISKNVKYQSARMGFSLARITKQDCCSNCSGDCLSLETPCACAGKTGREFAYTPEGLVKENFLNNIISRIHSVPRNDLFHCQDCPLEHSISGNSFGKCKGHVTRKFIKECWYKCGCSMNCGNRVVQRGITAKLQVFMTAEGKVWGLRTLEEVPKGAFICEYVGEVVTIGELFERNVQNSGGNRTYPVLLDADWSSKGVLMKDKDALCLDATVYGNIARFINHRCFDANLVGIPVEVETPDHHYYHLAFFTTRKVNALEELTWDYGIEFDECHPLKAFQCQCGSKFCRDHGSVSS